MKIKFVEHKGFVQGVPARDLTQAEWDELSDETKALALASGIYKVIVDKAEKVVSKDGEK